MVPPTYLNHYKHERDREEGKGEEGTDGESNKRTTLTIRHSDVQTLQTKSETIANTPIRADY